MAGFDVKCPKCGKQSAEYDENKWECLHCGNKFVYREESPAGRSPIPIDDADGNDSGTDAGKTADEFVADTLDIAAEDEDRLELFLDGASGGSAGDEAKLDIESFLDEDDDSKGTTSNFDTKELDNDYDRGNEALLGIDDADGDDDSDYEPLLCTDFDDYDDTGPQRPLRGQGKKISLIIVTVVLAVVLWIVSYPENEVKVKEELPADLGLVTRNQSIDGNKPNKPGPKPLPLQPDPAAGNTETQIYERVKPSTVLVITWDPANKQKNSLGSGFFVGDGEVVTNHHVVGDAKKGYRGYVQSLETEERYQIKAWKPDKERDLAILRVASSQVRPLTLGDSDLVKTTNDIYALGNPKGMVGTWTRGNISALRKIPPLGNIECFQISSPFDHGSSGCPVFNKKGEVIGIATASYSFSAQLGIAVPAKYIKRLLSRPGGFIPWPP